MIRRAAAVLLLTLLPACRCSRDLEPVMDAFRVPEELDVGAVPIGGSRRRTLEVTNLSRASLSLELTTAPPFALDSATFEVPAGSTAALPVVFRPETEGPAAGRLNLRAAGRSTAVALRGQGLPPCAAVDACHAAQFDDDAGRCVDPELPDGTACTGACVDGGTCSGGVCVGAFATCDDGDVCTVDACGATGECLHLPRACPITDPCAVARCDPQLGCVSEPISDGTVCGSATCATARVCIGGLCVDRPTPNAALDCRYTAVCAAASYTCASTFSEKLRCWGSGEALGRPARVVSPHFVAGATQVKAPLCDQGGPAWLTTAGAVAPIDPFVTANAGLGPLVDVLTDRLGWLGLDATGTAKLVRPGAGVWTYADRTALRIFPDLCVLHRDAGVLCAGGTRPVFSGRTPLEMTFSPYNFTWAALFSGGSVETSTGLVLADAGATAVGSLLDYRLCWGVPGELRCTAHWVPDSGSSIPWPDSTAALTSAGRAICGLSDAGQLTCWGENVFGETSDRGTEPEGLIRVGDGGFSSIAVAFGEVLLQRGDEVLATGSLGPDFDGGRPSISTRVGDSSLVSLGLLRDTTRVGHQCVIRAGGMWCWAAGTALRFVTGEIVRLCRTTSCGVDRSGRMWCMNPGGSADVRATGLSPADECPRSCRLHGDGGVTCPIGPWPEVRIVLPGAATLLTESENDGCAVAGGGVWCWRNLPPFVDGGVAAERVQGVRTPVRLLRAVDGYRCAVSGQNGLQCWKGNGPVADVAITQAIADLEIGSAGWGTNACVRYANGDVDCFGNNQFGQLGFVPNTGQQAVPVVR